MVKFPLNHGFQKMNDRKTKIVNPELIKRDKALSQYNRIITALLQNNRSLYNRPQITQPKVISI